MPPVFAVPSAVVKVPAIAVPAVTPVFIDTVKVAAPPATFSATVTLATERVAVSVSVIVIVCADTPEPRAAPVGREPKSIVKVSDASSRVSSAIATASVVV